MRIDVVLATRLGTGPADRVRLARMRAAGRAGVDIRVRIPDGAPTSITTAQQDARATPGVLAEILAAESDGADAVVVNCTADTGVRQARDLVSIPVVGVSESAFHLAAQLGDRFSVLTFAERIAPRFRSMARRWGMRRKLASVRSVETPLEEIADFEALGRSLLTQAELCLREDGAELIVLGCTDFENAADLLRDGLAEAGRPVPVLCPFELGMHQAAAMVDMHLGRRRRH